jgi:hypothetical protein
MATSEKHRADEDLASDVVAGIDVLERLTHGKHLSRLESIRVSIGPAEPDQGGPKFAECQVDIKGDTKGDRDTIKKIFTDKGWSCTNTGDKTATCTS